MHKRLLVLLLVLFSFEITYSKQKAVVPLFTIGCNDHSGAEFALGPSGYKDFLANDFGFEDRYFLYSSSKEKKDFPYVLPGPADTWGGTWNTAGWRTHEVNILFSLNKIPKNAEYILNVHLVDVSSKGSVAKININGTCQQRFNLSPGNDESLLGNASNAHHQVMQLHISDKDLKIGGNCINIAVLEGGWIIFDSVEFLGNKDTKITCVNEDAFVRNVNVADYEIVSEGNKYQPLLVDVEHLKGQPQISVLLDGTQIYSEKLDTSRYMLEVPMPSVKAPKRSKYEILVNGRKYIGGTISRAPQRIQKPADYVNTMIGSAHSRWMIAPGPWMPFSMVKLSPDNQNGGWQAGYQPTFETLGCMSHIHEWTMAGLGMMPTNGPLFTVVGDEARPDEGYRSRIDKLSEKAPLGYYRVHLTDTDILLEATATTRASFQRYTFPQDKDGRVMIDLQIPSEYGYRIDTCELKQVNDYRIEGFALQVSPRVWSSDADQEYKLHFVIEFDRPIKKMGCWSDSGVINSNSLSSAETNLAGCFVEFDTTTSPTVKVRSGISLVSINNAALNLNEEITTPFGWDFEAVVDNQHNVWNDILERVEIKTSDRREKERFYTNLYRSMCRNTWSDVNGDWVAPDETVHHLQPGQVALGCDAFWNTFWNLNQVWNLITPEWSSKWVQSQLALYDVGGWLAKGPAGMEYIPVMVAEHEIPQMVSAWQMGIRDYDGKHMLEAMIHQQTTPAVHVDGGFAGNRDLNNYLKYHYVPIELGRFSNTLEYSYDDWSVGQLAKSLGDDDTYSTFSDRGTWWKNAINTENGYAHLRDSLGNFISDFDPFHSGSNHHYVEGNAWQLSYFAPHALTELVDMLGRDAFVERLQWGFAASEPWRYNAPNDQYWDYPVVQGNQQSMHFSFLFNWAGRPDLTQYWTRSIIDRYYGYGIANAYLGDEDQGQMSAWFVMAALGLFQTDGGCRTEPVYELASPLFEKITIHLDGRYGRGKDFVINAKGASKKAKFIKNARLNGQPLNGFTFPARELLKGGTLELEMTE